MRNLVGATMAALIAVSAPLLADEPEPVTWPGFNVDRAVYNYRALYNGTRKLEDLSLIERREVSEIDRRVRLKIVDKRSPRQKCIDEEIADRGGSISKLESGIIDLACSQR